MPAAPLPSDEAERLKALLGCHILDTPPEQRFDDLTLLASRVAQAPIALVSLVDRDRQWFKSRVGLDVTETPRDQAFCAHAILTPEVPLVVADAAKDPRFIDNPLVTGGPGIRFYAGTPLVDEYGKALGTLCVIDVVPRELDAEQLESLQALGRQVVAQLRMTRLIRALQEQNDEQARSYRRMMEYKSRLEESVEQLEHLSTTDALTSLANRRAFEQQLLHELERSGRYGSPLSVVLIDIDHFKRINDQHGHTMGDQVLGEFGALLKANRRSCDTAARYGGEEFALILPNTGCQEALALAERLRQQFADYPLACGSCTVSVGVTAYRSDDSRDALLKRADEALYEAKDSGRNRVAHR
jgi:diguanylate cyclase (GGDEF)-like protein